VSVFPCADKFPIRRFMIFSLLVPPFPNMGDDPLLSWDKSRKARTAFFMADRPSSAHPPQGLFASFPRPFRARLPFFLRGLMRSLIPLRFCWHVLFTRLPSLGSPSLSLTSFMERIIFFTAGTFPSWAGFSVGRGPHCLFSLLLWKHPFCKYAQAFLALVLVPSLRAWKTPPPPPGV